MSTPPPTHPHAAPDWGDEWETGVKLVDGRAYPWVRIKPEHFRGAWVWLPFTDIIRKYLKIPLNDEMIKQCKAREGGVPFLWDLETICKSDRIIFTDKQVNFLARLLLANPDVPVNILRYVSHICIENGIRTRDIEIALKQSREANPEMFAKLKAEFEGIPGYVPLENLASVPDPRVGSVRQSQT